MILIGKLDFFLLIQSLFIPYQLVMLSKQICNLYSNASFDFADK